MKSVGLLAIAILLLCGTVYAERTIWYVHPDSTLNSIQAGLDSCDNNDVVLVGPGIYFENIVWPNTQGIYLVSEMGPDVTIIDGNSAGSVVEITSMIDSTTLLSGFTIQNGYSVHGGGIYCNNSSPCITDITITGNIALWVGGGGICCENASPSLTDVNIIGNSIDGDGDGGGIYCWNSSPSLTNITISGNDAITFLGANGGGIYCSANSNPILDNVTIIENNAGAYGMLHGDGGGIYCSGSSNMSLTDVTITGNHAMVSGGGICSNASELSLADVDITGNNARSGGGIYFDGSNASFVNVSITGNNVTWGGGGGICSNGSIVSLANVSITENSVTWGGGGGVCCNRSELSLTDVDITGNNARSGGGIYSDRSTLIFDSENSCNMFLNFAGVGCDLYAINCATIDLIADTFSVIQPDDHFAYPLGYFTFDILHAKVEQVNQDLYVSPDGSDDNSGLSVNDPLLTVSYALTKALSDSTNPLVIHLSSGVYSPSQTGERFPLNCRSHVSLVGEDEASSILDGEDLSGICTCINDNDFSIATLTLRNGRTDKGGGIYFDNSIANLSNVTIAENSAAATGPSQGGGIYCVSSAPNLKNVTIRDNIASSWIGGQGGGIYCKNSNPSMMNVLIVDNIVYGGIYRSNARPNPTNGIISKKVVLGRQAGAGGGIYCVDCSNVNVINSTMSGNNAANHGGGIFCDNSNLNTLNCILWDNSPQEIYAVSGSVAATYSDIQGGWPGLGNIDTYPMFASGPLSDYHLSSVSPCIDTGSSNPQYNDPEDPLNPGSALWPALKTVRNDMGVYGGPSSGGWVAVEEYELPQPMSTVLQISPNPFRDKVKITFSRVNNMEAMAFTIYDATGRVVREFNHLKNNQVLWNGTDMFNMRLPSGIYFLKLEARNYSATEKLLLIR
jgi:hypothetical protein